MGLIFLRNKVASGYTPTDSDAAAYITAVETADGQALEDAVREAIDDFVIGCKADGIWTAIKASCILAGARTLAGALTPLVGTAPTNNNFVSGDYNRKTGLVGDGSTKYIDTNRANNADPQNDNHNACWVSTAAAGALMASGSNLGGQNYLDITTLPNTRTSSRATITTDVSGTALAGLYGHSRSLSTNFAYLNPQGSNTNATRTSQTTNTRSVLVFSRTDNGITFSAYSSARISFYSIGENLTLASLESRVSTLMTDLGNAIP